LKRLTKRNNGRRQYVLAESLDELIEESLTVDSNRDEELNENNREEDSADDVTINIQNRSRRRLAQRQLEAFRKFDQTTLNTVILPAIQPNPTLKYFDYYFSNRYLTTINRGDRILSLKGSRI